MECQKCIELQKELSYKINQVDLLIEKKCIVHDYYNQVVEKLWVLEQKHKQLENKYYELLENKK